MNNKAVQSTLPTTVAEAEAEAEAEAATINTRIRASSSIGSFNELSMWSTRLTPDGRIRRTSTADELYGSDPSDDESSDYYEGESFEFQSDDKNSCILSLIATAMMVRDSKVELEAHHLGATACFEKKVNKKYNTLWLAFVAACHVFVMKYGGCLAFRDNKKSVDLITEQFNNHYQKEDFQQLMIDFFVENYDYVVDESPCTLLLY